MSDQPKPTKSHAGLPPFSKEYLENEHDAKTFGQPKPTTDEWTAERIIRHYTANISLTTAEGIANDINAALAAEREKSNNLERVAEAWEEDAKRYATNSDYYREQLAAEREKREEAENIAAATQVELDGADKVIANYKGYPRFKCLICNKGANELASPHYLERVSATGKGAPALWLCTEHWNPYWKQQLAAEREKVGHLVAAHDVTCREASVTIQQLREQLSAAQAAMSEAKDVVYAVFHADKIDSRIRQWCAKSLRNLQSVKSGYGAAALDAAIAAAQQPLVECLTWLREELKADEYYVEKIDIAFAKMKKGKV